MSESERAIYAARAEERKARKRQELIDARRREAEADAESPLAKFARVWKGVESNAGGA